MGVAWCFGEVLVLLSMLHHRHCGVEPALSAHVYVTCWNVLGGILLRMHVVGRLLERSWSAGLLLLMALLFKWAVGGVVLWYLCIPKKCRVNSRDVRHQEDADGY